MKFKINKIKITITPDNLYFYLNKKFSANDHSDYIYILHRIINRDELQIGIVNGKDNIDKKVSYNSYSLETLKEKFGTKEWSFI